MEFGLSKNHQRNEKVEKRIQTALDWLDARSTDELLAEPLGLRKLPKEWSSAFKNMILVIMQEWIMKLIVSTLTFIT